MRLRGIRIDIKGGPYTHVNAAVGTPYIKAPNPDIVGIDKETGGIPVPTATGRIISGVNNDMVIPIISYCYEIISSAIGFYQYFSTLHVCAGFHQYGVASDDVGNGMSN